MLCGLEHVTHTRTHTSWLRQLYLGVGETTPDLRVGLGKPSCRELRWEEAALSFSEVPRSVHVSRLLKCQSWAQASAIPALVSSSPVNVLSELLKGRATVRLSEALHSEEILGTVTLPPTTHTKSKQNWKHHSPTEFWFSHEYHFDSAFTTLHIKIFEKCFTFPSFILAVPVCCQLQYLLDLLM